MSYDKFTCEKCGSEDLIVLQTISSGPVQIICKTCKHEEIVNEALYNKLIDVYRKYLSEKGLKETEEEQGRVEVYV